MTVGVLTMKIHVAKHGEETWYLPNIHLPISITNDGARPGKVLGLRIVIHYPDLPIPENHEIFLPRYDEVAESIKEWMPFVVLPKNTVSQNLVFHSRWDNAVLQKYVKIHLEMFPDSKKKWVRVSSWNFSLHPEIWDGLVNEASYSVKPDTELPMGELVYPKDLHKYTGIK